MSLSVDKCNNIFKKIFSAQFSFSVVHYNILYLLLIYIPEYSKYKILLLCTLLRTGRDCIFWNVIFILQGDDDSVCLRHWGVHGGGGRPGRRRAVLPPGLGVRHATACSRWTGVCCSMCIRWFILAIHCTLCINWLYNVIASWPREV